jgi:hypothetical protein
LFYPSKIVDFYNNNIDSCDLLFSHGKFNNSWRKSSSQVVDIKYTVTIEATKMEN